MWKCDRRAWPSDIPVSTPAHDVSHLVSCLLAALMHMAQTTITTGKSCKPSKKKLHEKNNATSSAIHTTCSACVRKFEPIVFYLMTRQYRALTVVRVLKRKRCAPAYLDAPLSSMQSSSNACITSVCSSSTRYRETGNGGYACLRTPWNWAHIRPVWVAESS